MPRLFKPSGDAFSFMGRIDFSDKDKPLFIYAGSMVKTRFSGTSLSLAIENVFMGEYSAIGVLIDGVQQKLELSKESNSAEYQIAQNLYNKMHDLIIFKRQGASHYFRLIGIITDDDAILEKYNEKLELKIEVFGDSVSAGEVCEAIYYEGSPDPVGKPYGFYDNSWFGYPLVLGRKLNAFVHDNAQGGIALLNNTGYFGPDNAKTGVEETYDKLSYVNYSPFGYTDWDFSRYAPDCIIMALGQNDAHPAPEKVYDAEYMSNWKEKYKGIILDLKDKYNNKPRFILITTLLMHDAEWDNQLDALCLDLNDSKVLRYKFKRNGIATPGHPRITEQEEMASELAEFIKCVGEN